MTIAAERTAPHRTRLDPDTIAAITAQARQAKPGQAALSVIGGLLFTVGWVIAKVFAVLWLSAAWCFAATRMGWRQARGIPLDQPSVEDVLAENIRLRAELSRVT